LEIEKQGLSNTQVLELRQKYGFNEIKVENKSHFLKLFCHQFVSFLVLILVFATILSFAFGDVLDGIAIFAIIVINGIIGFLQEYKAENAVKALKKMLIPKTVVYRNGIQLEISSRELVPGDLVFLSEGDKIPSDCDILQAFAFRVDESILTGESKTVYKKEGQVFSGTLVTSGKAYVKVTHIGKDTQFGKIVSLVAKEKKTDSLLNKEMDKLSKKLGIGILIFVVVLFILGLIEGLSIYNTLITAIALGVSAIPEGLPIIITLTLAIGTQILARKKAIIRKMSAIETLGSTTTICCDKTGTLTLNEMTVKKVKTISYEFDVPGTGYSWKDKINIVNDETSKLLDVCENCNNSNVESYIIGDSTEVALKVLTRKANCVNKCKELDEIPFSSERKMMSTLVFCNSKKQIFTKGAFEEVIKKSSFILDKGRVRKIDSTDKELFTKINTEYSEDALRVIAFAYKDYTKDFDEESLIFVGLVGMIDPPREDVPGALALAKGAGIKVKIITGDNNLTAKAIAKRIGLPHENVVLGSEIDKMTDNELKEVIRKTHIFARTNPEHKYRVVSLLQEMGEIVSVTGDGVNDAPALKKSDVGIAMGIKGTEATREVADIVLKDDNFATIISAISEGRRLYANILLFVKFMLSANFGMLIFVAILSLARLPLPLLALQILWINIVTDSLPALALGMQGAEENIMRRTPAPRHANLFVKFWKFILITLVFYILACLVVFWYGYVFDKGQGIDLNDFSQPSKARTLVFTQIVVMELVLAFSCAYKRQEFFFKGIKAVLSNWYLIGAVLISFGLQLIVVYLPFFQLFFKTVPLNIYDWLIIFALSLLMLFVPLFERLLEKAVRKKEITS